mgnify:CR=1 FL=1
MKFLAEHWRGITALLLAFLLGLFVLNLIKFGVF